MRLRMWVRRAAFAAAVFAVVGMPRPAAAHEPTEGVAEYSQQATQKWVFGLGATSSWFTSAVRAALGSNWNGDDTTQAPTWDEDVYGATIRYRSNAQTPDTAECPSTFWYACTDYLDPGETTWDYTVLNSVQNALGNTPWYWCQDPAQPNTGCIDVQRVMLHEAGHAAGLSRSSNSQSHQPDSLSSSDSVMQSNPKQYPASGYNYRALGFCDILGLQLVYDVRSSANTYGDCADHVPGEVNAGGLISVTTTSQSGYDECLGFAITVSGRLALRTTTDYGRISNNPLTNRIIWFDRRRHGGTTWTYNVTSTIASNASGYNWAKSFTTGSTTTITYDFRGHFDGEVAIDDDTTPVFTLTWLAPPC